MISLTSEYALRAMIHLAQHGGDAPVPATVIAKETGIPHKYLSSVLGDLVRGGILASAPGKRGGFRMLRSPKGIRLHEVLSRFEPVLGNRRPCPFGNTECNDDDPCAGHDKWKRVRNTYERFLEETTVYDVAVKKKSGRGRTTKKRSSLRKRAT